MIKKILKNRVRISELQSELKMLELENERLEERIELLKSWFPLFITCKHWVFRLRRCVSDWSKVNWLEYWKDNWWWGLSVKEDWIYLIYDKLVDIKEITEEEYKIGVWNYYNIF